MKRIITVFALVSVMGCESNENPIDVTKTVPTELTFKGSFEGQTISLTSKKMVTINGTQLPEVAASIIKRQATDPETLTVFAYLNNSRAFTLNYVLRPDNTTGDYAGFNGTGSITQGQMLTTIIDPTNTRFYNTFNTANNRGKVEVFDRVYRNMKVTVSGIADRITAGDTIKAPVSYSFTAEGLVLIP